MRQISRSAPDQAAVARFRFDPAPHQRRIAVPGIAVAAVDAAIQPALDRDLYAAFMDVPARGQQVVLDFHVVGLPASLLRGNPLSGDRPGSRRRIGAGARQQQVGAGREPGVDDSAGSAALVDRILTGAHYGLRSWLVQRVSAVVMALYTLFIVNWLLLHPDLDYNAWNRIVFQQRNALVHAVDAAGAVLPRLGRCARHCDGLCEAGRCAPGDPCNGDTGAGAVFDLVGADIVGILMKFVFQANRGVVCSLIPRLPTGYVSSLAARLLALHPEKQIANRLAR